MGSSEALVRYPGAEGPRGSGRSFPVGASPYAAPTSTSAILLIGRSSSGSGRRGRTFIDLVSYPSRHWLPSILIKAGTGVLRRFAENLHEAIVDDGGLETGAACEEDSPVQVQAVNRPGGEHAVPKL